MRIELRRNSGYTLVETLVVMVIMGIVFTALTALFVTGTNAEVEMNKRFQAQVDARVAIDRLRREVHCASGATPTGPSNAVTLTLPTGCRVGTGAITWCALSVDGDSHRYRLYRSVSDPCGSTGDGIYADYLDLNSGAVSVFNLTLQSNVSRAKLEVVFPVDLEPDKPGSYRLEDALVMRNTTRSCIAASPSPPC